MTVQPVDYGRFLAMAERLLTRWGQMGTMSKQKTTGPSNNPTPAAPDITPARMAVLDYRADLIDGTRIRASDKEVYVSPVGLTFEPAMNVSVIDALGTPVGKIIDFETIRPATTTVLYVLHCRR